MKAGALAQADVHPQIHSSCVICLGRQARLLASAEELEAQRRYLRLFHRRRLLTRRPDALEERADFTQDYATNVVACCDCGLLARDPRPDDDAIARAYEQDSYGERLDALFDSQLELHRSKIQVLRRLLAGREQPVVLEIGSFVGGFLAASAELGWRATGIDPGREVADYCAARGLSVLRENVEDCEFPAQAADCVAIWNTFDQLPDPRPTLTSARRCLRDGGLLVVRVPNGLCFEACMKRLRGWPHFLRSPLLAAMAWNNLLSFPYLHGYALPTLDRLMAQYGFERIHDEGDVLTRLADYQTKAWAAWEETVLKSAWKGWLRAWDDGGAAAPWLDVYYRAA